MSVDYFCLVSSLDIRYIISTQIFTIRLLDLRNIFQSKTWPNGNKAHVWIMHKTLQIDIRSDDIVISTRQFKGAVQVPRIVKPAIKGSQRNETDKEIIILRFYFILSLTQILHKARIQQPKKIYLYYIYIFRQSCH